MNRGLLLGLAVSAAAAASVMACGGKQLDVGNDGSMGSGAGSGLGGSTGVNGSNDTSGVGAYGNVRGPGVYRHPGWPDPSDCMTAPNSELVGQWRGHWPFSGEYNAPTGDALLTIEGLTADGLPCGSLRVGEPAALEPATDPDAPYPPTMGVGGSSATGAPMLPFTGYEHRLLEVESSPTRLAFSLSYNEVFRSWCWLQTGYPDSGTCLPNISGGHFGSDGCTITPQGSSKPVAVSCFKATHCKTMFCACTDEGCDGDPGTGLSFDLHWDDQNLEGSVNGTPIFLDRVP